MTQRCLPILMHNQSCLFYIKVWATDDFSSYFFFLLDIWQTWSKISLGEEYFSSCWFRWDLRKQRVIYKFNLLKACELNMLGFNIDIVMFNSSCICFCEWGFKKANLLTSFLADTEVVALWVCFHLLIYSHLYFWLLLQKNQMPWIKTNILIMRLQHQTKAIVYEKKNKKSHMVSFIIKHNQWHYDI